MDMPLHPPAWEPSATWAEQAQAWIVERLSAAGRSLSGPLEPVRNLPWSLVLTGMTDRGRIYFKAVAPECAYEVRLSEALARWEPELTLAPLACDTARAWLLLPDGGHTWG
jgi:hypothetical protein